jgi:hypothetical protein
MVEVSISCRKVEMFQCIFAAFNASDALNILKRVFFGSRPDGHLIRSERHCTIFGISSMAREG